MKLHFKNYVLRWIMPTAINAFIFRISPSISPKFQIKPLFFEFAMRFPNPVIVAIFFKYQCIPNPVMDFVR